MFFRPKYSKNSKKPVLQLIESIRTEKGPRQRVVVSLGTHLHIPKEKQSEVARVVKERLLGQKSLFDHNTDIIAYSDKVVKKIQTDGKWHSTREQVCKFKEEVKGKPTAEVFVDDVQHCYNRELGPLLIGHHFWNQLDFPTILSECGFKEKQVETAEVSILNRLIAQDPENKIPLWIQTSAVPDLLNIKYPTWKIGNDRFYRISDKLLRNQDKIEKLLYQREKDLFNLEDCIFLYDLTNTYFEGICANNPKAEYNANQKEKRTDCPQVVVAIVLDSEGFIRRHRIFTGKMSDTKSFEKILTLLEKDFSEASAKTTTSYQEDISVEKDKQIPTFIFDRGITSDDNIKLLQSKKLKYIVACRSCDETDFIPDFKNGEFNILRDGGDSKEKKIEILLKHKGDELFLLCKSEGRQSKETAMRNNREIKFEDKLINLSNQIRKGRENNPVNIERRIGRLHESYSSVAKYYKITYQHCEFSYNIQSKYKNKLSKRLKNSLKILEKKSKNNTISFPKIKKKLSEFEQKYRVDYSKINIHIKEPVLTWHTIDELEAEERAMDGNYLLKTNRKDLDQVKIWNTYMMLMGLENAFRDIKSHLGLRPNYHQKEPRVDGHINISILSYHLLHSIEYTLKQKDDHSRWSTIKRLMSTHNYSTIQLPTVNGTVINVRKAGVPEAIHIDIYKKLGISYSNLPIRKTLA